VGHLVQPRCQSRVSYSRLHRTLSRQVLNIFREGDSITSLDSLFQCSVTLRVLHPGLEPSAQERHGPVGVGPEEGHKNDLKVGAPQLWGKLRELGLFILDTRRLWGHFIAAFRYLKGAYKKAGEGLFTRACSDSTGGNGFTMKEGRFRLDIRKKFFTLRVVRHWNTLPRGAVEAPSL